MRTIKSILCCLVVLAFSLPSNAQTNPEPTFFIVAYMKVKPGMYDKYLALEQNVWKKVHQTRIKQGKEINWWLYEVRLPSGTSSEYDFVTVNAVKGWNGVDSFYTGWNQAFKGLSKREMAVVDSTELIRDMVRTELVYGADGIFKPDAEKNPSRYLMVNFMDVPDGRWDEYEAMESQLAKPMHDMDIKAGTRGGWGLYSVVFPRGAERTYDAITVDFFDKWEDINRGGNYEEMLKKAHPGMSMEYFSRQIDESRKLVRGEAWIMLDHAQ